MTDQPIKSLNRIKMRLKDRLSSGVSFRTVTVSKPVRVHCMGASYLIDFVSAVKLALSWPE